MFSNALIAKWEWRIGVEGVGKWKKILISKYGNECARNSGICSVKHQSCGGETSLRLLRKINGSIII